MARRKKRDVRRRGNRPQSEPRPAGERDAPAGEGTREERPAACHRRRILELFAHVGVPVGFALLIWITIPFMSFYEVDPDEGNNVIKALLLAEGHPLYTETWSDQAPLFTYALEWWFDVFGYTTNAARVLVLVCASVLLWAAYQTLRIAWGHYHAIAGTVLIVLIPYFAALSVSIMLGLPALMWATVALLTVSLWHRQGKTHWLVLSAVALSLSVLTKLFTGFLAPVFGLGILVHTWVRDRGQPRPVRRLIPAAVWSGTFMVVTGIVTLAIVSPSEVSQLIEPHVAARQVYAASENPQTITWRLTGEGHPGGCEDIIILAVIGTALAALRRESTAWYPAAWALLAYLLLRDHAPIWYHHVLLVMVPCAILGGIAVGELIPKSRKVLRLPRTPVDVARTGLRLCGFAAAVAVIAFMPSKLVKSYELGNMIELAPRDRYLTAVMKEYAPKSEWVFADRQIYAFNIHRPVPPNLSVTSLKRMRAGLLTLDDILTTFDEYEPEQIVFCGYRMPMRPLMARYLKQHYTTIYTDDLNRRGGRAGIHIRKGLEGDYVAALIRAIETVPACREAHDNLGRWAGERGDTDAAIEHYRQALEIDPTYDRAVVHLAETLLAMERFDDGFRVYRNAIPSQRPGVRSRRLSPFLAVSFARRLATCPDPRFRDGNQAERLAVAAVKANPRSADYLDVLAAAYAEQGRFQDAIRSATRALSLATERRQQGLAQRVQARLARYQANHAYQERPSVPGFDD